MLGDIVKGATTESLSEGRRRGFGSSKEDWQAYAGTAGAYVATALCAELGPASAACGVVGQKIGAWLGGVAFDAIDRVFGNAAEWEAYYQRQAEIAAENASEAGANQAWGEMTAALERTVGELSAYAQAIGQKRGWDRDAIIGQLGIEGLPLEYINGAWRPPNVVLGWHSRRQAQGWRKASEWVALTALEWLGKLQRTKVAAMARATAAQAEVIARTPPKKTSAAPVAAAALGGMALLALVL